VVSKGIEEYKSLVQGELQMADCVEQVFYGSIALAGCILAVWQPWDRNCSKGVLERIIGVLKGRYDKVSCIGLWINAVGLLFNIGLAIVKIVD
jgi:hypothetical protein